MKILCAAAMLVLLTGPAFAQMPSMNLIPETASKTPDEIEADKARDREYKESLKKIPDAKASSDPWGTVRSDAPKTTAPAKTAKNATAKAKTVNKTRTGSNTPN